MTTLQAEMKPFDYLSGKDFTEKLKDVTNCDTYLKLADVYGIPRTTITTWHTHNRTAFELIVRTHLATGASVRYMALGEGEPFDNKSEPMEALQTFRLVDGALVEAGKVSLDLGTLDRFGLKPSLTKVIEDDARIYYVNTESSNPTSGKYLIDIDGQLSINLIQRLPGHKLSINIGNNSFEASVDDIKVLGRVAMTMNKE
ncbi:TPA: transcriptional regulator [Vibrio parahaemolyticus]|nr:transcriptional regulator [Vibrio parahaemolyticus]